MNIYTEGKMEKLETVTLKKETFEQMIGSISNMAKDFGAIASNFRLKANVDAQEIGKHMAEKPMEESPKVSNVGLSGVRNIFESQKSILNESIIQSREKMFLDSQIELEKLFCAKKSEKPPLGLTPKKVNKELNRKSRLKDVYEAINRYLQAEKSIPSEWVDEYNELLRFGDKF